MGNTPSEITVNASDTANTNDESDGFVNVSNDDIKDFDPSYIYNVNATDRYFYDNINEHIAEMKTSKDETELNTAYNQALDNFHNLKRTDFKTLKDLRDSTPAALSAAAAAAAPANLCE